MDKKQEGYVGQSCGNCKWLDHNQYGHKPSCRDNGKTEESESCCSKED